MQEPTRLKRNPVDPRALPFDAAKFAAICADLDANAGAHRPAKDWLFEGWAPPGEPTDRFRADNVMRHWLGFAATRVTPNTLRWYYPFLSAIDRFGLTDCYFADESTINPTGRDLLVADLGTIVDLNLATAFLDLTKPLTVVEIGGGYGRLAEAFFNILPSGLKYLLVDAVPTTLLHAREYLRRSNPGIRVGAYHNGDTFDFDAFDCYIMPPWRLDQIGPTKFDLAINVQGFQEMDQHHVDFYLDWIDSTLVEGGIGYFVNRLDHLFTGTIRYPANWECLLKTTTPRAFARDLPTELFRRLCGGAAGNDLRERLYRHEAAGTRAATLASASARGLCVY